MYNPIVVRSNQDIYDICLQVYGTLELLGKLIKDNNLPFSGEISQGDILLIDSDVIGNNDVMDFFELGKKHPQNGYTFKNNIPPLNWDNNQITFDSTIQTWDLIKL